MEDFDALNTLTNEEVLALASELLEYKKYNKIHFFKPYDYQIDIMNATKKYNICYARSGNRTGKTVGAAAHFAMLLTGLYQDYYNGVRINKSGHDFLCVGVNQDSTAKVLQKELLGTSDMRFIEQIGTGMIPRDCIDMEGMTKDGGRCLTIRIRHVDGGWNNLHFFAVKQNHMSIAGMKVKAAWKDEESADSADIDWFNQLIARIATTDGDNGDSPMGHFIWTSTPEQGMTEQNILFEEDSKKAEPEFYLRSVSMYEAPHLTPEAIEKLLAIYPANQRKMRIYGLPVLGKGAVFSIRQEDISCGPVLPQPHWFVNASIDWGTVNDPTVVSFNAYDPDTETYYIYDQYNLTAPMGEPGDRSPKSVAEIIKRSYTPNIPIIVPNDSGWEEKTGLGQLLANEGVNVQKPSFKNPASWRYDSSLTSAGSNTSAIAIEPGIQFMRQKFQEGKLKVVSTCTDFFYDLNAYSYTGRKQPAYTGRDHNIEAARYGIVSLYDGRSSTFSEAQQLERIETYEFTESYARQLNY